jgi:CubicO group peptidase (beta-lactamase class C family)
MWATRHCAEIVVRRAGALLLLALAVAGCGGRETPPSPQPRLSLTAAAQEGFDPVRLATAERRFATTPGLVSVLAARHGRLVFEHYYLGATGRQEQNVFSVTKSVISALIGIALARGELHGLDQRLVSLFPEKLDGDSDPGVRTITIRDLLTMSSGYRETSIHFTDDWVRTLLNRPVESTPGTVFSYDDGSAHLLSAVLMRATGLSASALARRELFAPLGIRLHRWASDQNGLTLGSTGLFLRPRDLLKLGRLYLQHGNWHGRQVVPSSWVRESTKRQIAIPGGYAYGYLWWVNTGPHGGFVAQGFGGQSVAVFPRIDLVIVTTGDGRLDPRVVWRSLLRSVAA